MKLERIVFGLGNYPKRYRRTRHNIGFSIVEEFVKTRLGESFSWPLFGAYGLVVKDATGFALPRQYMNLNGQAIRPLKKKYPESRLLVVHDDLDIEFGRLKMKRGGGSAGHKGLQSVIDTIQTKEFDRLRIGIGRPRDMDVVEYVLSIFDKDEESVLDSVFQSAFAAIELWIEKDDINEVIPKVNGLNSVKGGKHVRQI